MTTGIARFRSLIRPSLISPRTTINWSPGHQIPSCDYAQDSNISTIYTATISKKISYGELPAVLSTHKCTVVQAQCDLAQALILGGCWHLVYADILTIERTGS